MGAILTFCIGLFFTAAGIGGLNSPTGDKSAGIIVVGGILMALLGGGIFVGGKNK